MPSGRGWRAGGERAGQKRVRWRSVRRVAIELKKLLEATLSRPVPWGAPGTRQASDTKSWAALPRRPRAERSMALEEREALAFCPLTQRATVGEDRCSAAERRYTSVPAGATAVS